MFTVSLSWRHCKLDTEHNTWFSDCDKTIKLMDSSYYLIFGRGDLSALLHLNSLPVDAYSMSYGVAVFYWLIEELYKALPEELADIELEVINFLHWSGG
jgi:dihydrodipicolinate reductase